MLTRCPHCTTTFRVTPEQLKARLGKVRCGECQQVFNAVETLVEERVASSPRDALPIEAAAEDAVPAAQSPVLPASPEEPPEEQSPLLPLVMDAALGPETADMPVNDGPDQAEEIRSLAPEQAFDPEPGLPPESPATIPDETPSPIADAGPALNTADPFLHEAPTKSRRNWPWVLGGTVATLALGLQFALHFRVELAVIAPGSRPLLEAACAPFGCEVDLPAKPELMLIDSSDLIPDPERKGVMTLAATLRNQAPFAQAYPSLELTLTDVSNQSVARRIFSPSDYLPAKADVAGGLAARGELAVNLPLDTGQVAASGYRLYLFYP